jgi:hypothetical protein
MSTSRKSLLCAGLLAASFASTGAFAQAPATPAPPAADAQPGARPSAHRPPSDAERTQRFEQMQQRHAQHLSSLKDALKLSPAQESAWSTFAAAQQLPSPADHPRMDRAELAKLTTPQRLDLMQQRQAERSAMFTKRADATRTFYAALTPEQQKTFDAESMRRFGPGAHEGEHGGHHRPAPPAKS